ncbi:MAG: hypothetical protein A2286_06380 [Gammaproteobacteria bacterium RIFOXYA12_FULL_61_12]|nr:MAG: hypothetical protein A2514_00660 [Gammaproteobacteria bacterium RIFOXYD12_FULL_61_37]OGT93723.1 MAG: hypothetical protein A2286_06380 [Gammaproteobacteria bacterium RIFOXYA12_FULL_61_12]
MRPRFLLALLLPFIACGLQWLLWDGYIKPYVWFLFFPAAFFSAWLGGLTGGLVSTVTGALLVWYLFIPPSFSFALEDLAAAFSIALFILMGALFAGFFERLQRAMRRTDEALAETRAANERITELYQKTLELDELKSQFFANVSHELRTPLTLIMAPLAQRVAKAGLTEAERSEDGMMLRNARLLYRQVTDLLDAAKLEAGGMTLDYRRFDLCRLVQAMASNFDSLARERGIGLRIDVPPHLTAEADGEKLQRILLNLLSNAIKFTPDGGAIEVRLREEGDQVLIEVRDNGPGVPSELREAVFERFRQLEGGPQRRFGGTGLGLAIVKEFAELHGGRAGLTDAPGGGALFSVSLPLKAPEGRIVREIPAPLDETIEQGVLDELARVAAPSAPLEEGGNGRPLVLVVEDNPDMNGFIAGVLRPGYSVATAFDGQEGLEKALALRPDLILADVMMPRMSGDQMALALRRRPEMADVPILMLTAKADRELRLRLLKAGVREYLIKPFNAEELLARIGGLVKERRRTLGELREREERLQLFIDHAPAALAMFDREMRYLAVSRRWMRDYGLGERDIIGLSHYQVFPEIGEDLKVIHQRGLAGEVMAADEVRFERADGQVQWLRWEMRPWHRAEGGVGGILIFSEDISRLVEAKREIIALNADLERRVVERTAELIAANRELDSFSYAVSHDLRAPLRAMSGFSQALVEDFGGQLPGEARVYLDQIGIASRKMGELIDGLLSLSRSTRGEMERDRVDLTGMARRQLGDLARSDPARRAVTEVEEGLEVWGDRRMIEVVMTNLLGNAWKYSAKAAEARIRVHAEDRDGRRWICVADNGAGFDMAHAAKLFHPFQRLHRQEEFPGIGIGLATVQRIVQRHGGGIVARGEPGKGAAFCFSLAGEGNR